MGSKNLRKVLNFDLNAVGSKEAFLREQNYPLIDLYLYKLIS